MQNKFLDIEENSEIRSNPLLFFRSFFSTLFLQVLNLKYPTMEPPSLGKTDEMSEIWETNCKS